MTNISNETSIAPVPVTEIPPHPTASTYNWDTVVALHFNTTNSEITDNWSGVDSRVKTLSQAASDDVTYSIQATLNPWQLTTGGDGKNVNMVVPFASGTYQAGTRIYSLDGLGMQAVIQINMDWIPSPDQISFVINSGVATIVGDLEKGIVDTALINEFAAQGITINSDWLLSTRTVNAAWLLGAPDDSVFYYLFFSEDSEQNQFLTVYEYTDSFSSQLIALSRDAGGTPAVVLMNILNPPDTGSIGNAVLPELLSEWFNSNISFFNFIFSVVDLTPQLDKSPAYTWITPTATSYAVVDKQSMSSSVMAVLTMTQNNMPGRNYQVSPNAIPAGDDANGADVGMLISGQNFLKNMMLGGARQLFDNASDQDFSIFNEGLSIKNINKLTYGYFKMDDEPDATTPDNGYSSALDQGTVPQGLIDAFRRERLGGKYHYDPDLRGDTVRVNVAGSQWFLSGNGEDYIVELNDGVLEFYTATQITVAAGQFEMTLEHSYLEIKFIDLTYSQSAQYNVHINYTEQVSLGLKTVTTSTGENKQIFTFTQSARSMNIDVTKTSFEITLEIVMAALTASLALVAVLGPVVNGLLSGAEVAVESAEAGSAVIDELLFFDELASTEEAAALNTANEEAALVNAGEQASGRMTNIKNAFTSTRWRLFSSVAALTAAATATEVVTATILADVYHNNWDDVPGFDEFAIDAIGPYAFPGVNGYELKSAWLADSLQIGLKAL